MRCARGLGLALLVCASCSALVDLQPALVDTRSDGGTSVSDSGVQVDASRPQDAGRLTDTGVAEAAVEAGPPPCMLPQTITNRGFESGLSGWDMFYESNAIARASAAHSGAAGVHFCSKQVNSFYGVFQPQSHPAGKYHMRAWVRRASDADAGDQLTGRFLMFFNPTDAEQRSVTVPSTAQSWSCVDLTTTGTKPVTQVAVAIGGTVQESTCLDVDDVELFEVPDSGLPPECACPLAQ